MKLFFIVLLLILIIGSTSGQGLKGVAKERRLKKDSDTASPSVLSTSPSAPPASVSALPTASATPTTASSSKAAAKPSSAKTSKTSSPKAAKAAKCAKTSKTASPSVSASPTASPSTALPTSSASPTTRSPKKGSKKASKKGATKGSTANRFGSGGDESCMGDDSVGITKGVSKADKLSCNAGDVKLATVTVTGNSPVTCSAGDTITVSLDAQLQSSSSSRRSDIGVWIANDEESSAQASGSCSHFYFPAGDDVSAGQLPDLGDDGDGTCGDIGDKQEFQLPLNTPQAEVNIPCVDTDGDGWVDVDYCLSWKTPGTETECPLGASFRSGTVPGTSSKCKCDRVNVNICLDPDLCGTAVSPRTGEQPETPPTEPVLCMQ